MIFYKVVNGVYLNTDSNKNDTDSDGIMDNRDILSLKSNKFTSHFAEYINDEVM